MAELILNEKDIKIMLDKILHDKTSGTWWNKFYKDRTRTIPFMISVPDENLIEYIGKKIIKCGNALDIGCGNGRNSLYLAQQGFKVTGIDFSSDSIKNAKSLHDHKNISYQNVSVFEYDPGETKYDFIYDGGCLHHIAPHRRPEYLEKINRLLKKSGKYGMEIFNEDGGENLTDYQVYIERSMKGGLAYSKEKLKKILSPYYNIIEIRRMKEITDGSAFGKSFCWAVLMEKNNTELE